MGLANLVPGVSGGTMILAMGLYDRFIGAVADITSLRWSVRSFVFLGIVAVGLAVAVLGFSGVMVQLVTEYRWIMYSLFVGMTLGGVPQLVGLCRPLGPRVFVAAAAGIGTMVLLAFGLSAVSIPQTALVFVVVGAFAASSMILPGVSGSYILLILGMYDVVIGSLSSSELREDLGGSLRIIVPVAIGSALGIGLLSNLLKAMLARFPRASHGFLLGLLLGSVIGLVPFQRPVDPDLARRPFRKSVAMLLDGAPVAEVEAKYGLSFDEAAQADVRARYGGKSAGELKLAADELEYFRPDAVQIGVVLVLIAAGFAVTRFLHFENDEEAPPAADAAG
jgi:putative membrane protein